MGLAVLSSLYALVLLTAVAAARTVPPRRSRAGVTGGDLGARRPRATLAALAVVGVPTLLQLTVAPGLLGALRRDWTSIERGQVWRLLTALVVQDGGVPGAVFNLVTLALVGATAEAAWGARRWLVVALVGGLGSQLWGRLVQPVGAGNSVVVFALAASVAVLAVRAGPARARLLGLVSLAGGVVLLVVGDLHGGAVALGAVLGLLLGRRERGRAGQPAT